MELRRAIHLHLSVAMDDLIEVNTVDGFQGREKEFILFSCVRTESVGFLSDERRLNVAITRAKSCCLLVGKSTCLRRDCTWRAFLDHLSERYLLFDRSVMDKLLRTEENTH